MDLEQLSRSAVSACASGPDLLGQRMPNFGASMFTASTKPTFSCSSRNLKTSPPAPQPKQWKKPLSRIDVERGRLLEWNGHRPLYWRPPF